MKGGCPFSSRRGFLAAAAGLVTAAAGPAVTADHGEETAGRQPMLSPPALPAAEPFWGEHQGGIVTPAQTHTYFASFDLITTKAADVVKLMTIWTNAAARMAAGETAEPLGDDLMAPGADSGDALGLAPFRLTFTFGFGAGLFEKDGKDRYGLASRRPDALVDMPQFNGDQLVEARTGGDLSIQACADDAEVAFHGVRQLARLAYGVAQLRWVQAGFNPATIPGSTPRNLLGFKDGTQNPVSGPPDAANPVPGSLEDVVWVADDGPAWMRGGSYVVARRIRMSLEHWDRSEVDFQEQVIGRRKYSGAPLGGSHEFDALDLDAVDSEGNPVIPDTAHVRLAAAATNDGAQILRRSYSYNDGANVTAERWPPWRQELMFDAGLLFVCYQRDPRTGFIRINESISKLDMLNQFVTHTGSGLFACPGGMAKGQSLAAALFDRA